MKIIWDTILRWLEWSAKYGLIDIVFGIGIFTLVWRAIRRHWPRNLRGLQVDTRSEFGHVGSVVANGQKTTLRKINPDYDWLRITMSHKDG